jgi:hypothetical protein
MHLSGAIAQSLYDPSGAARNHWLSVLSYSRTMVGSGILFCAGMAIGIHFITAYVNAGFEVSGDMIAANHLAVAGLLVIILSFQTFVSTLLFHAVAAYTANQGSPQ